MPQKNHKKHINMLNFNMQLIWLKEGHRKEIGFYSQLRWALIVIIIYISSFLPPGINFNYGSLNEILASLKKAPTTVQDFCLDNELQTTSLLTQKGSSEIVPSCPKSDHSALILVLGVSQSNKSVNQRLLVGADLFSWALATMRAYLCHGIFYSKVFISFISNSICMCVCVCVCMGV